MKYKIGDLLIWRETPPHTYVVVLEAEAGFDSPLYDVYHGDYGRVTYPEWLLDLQVATREEFLELHGK